MPRRLAHAILSLAVLIAPAAARAESASQLFYERAVMSQAGGRCGLFDPGIAAALAAGEAQARNAALRGGVSPAVLDATLDRARSTADAAACGSGDVKIAANRVRSAFKAYAGLRTMTFPGDIGDWRAVRAQTVSNSAWRLSQSSSAGADRMMLGLAGRQGQDVMIVTAAFADGATPYAARLTMRDPARAPSAYIANLSGKAGLASRLPPTGAATRAILAEARVPAELALLPLGASTAAAFRFPASAAQALASLDPREAVSVDFVFAGAAGDRVRRAYFEVGDFAAGLAFLRAGQR
jgi:hypothetical protein